MLRAMIVGLVIGVLCGILITKSLGAPATLGLTPCVDDDHPLSGQVREGVGRQRHLAIVATRGREGAQGEA